MTWTTVVSHISFDVGSWSIQPGATPVTTLSDEDQTALLNQLQSLYNSSDLGQTMLDAATAGGKILRIGMATAGTPGFHQAGAGS